jgi:Holliday junction DNA helicase RuvB
MSDDQETTGPALAAHDRLAAEEAPQEREDIWNLRPRRMEELVELGQQRIIEPLLIAIEAARQREEPLEHVLFHGPPGLGKTTLAHIIAAEMDSQIVTASGPAIERGGDLISILTHLERGDVLFIDEIHRLAKPVEELLYPAMEDFAVDFIFDKGIHARSHRYRLEQFTLVGGTTRAGLLSSPLRQRFGIFRDLDFYTVEEVTRVVKRSARILEVTIDDAGATEIARRSRGTLRIANRLLRRVRDFAQVKGDGTVNCDTARRALKMEGVDAIGLTQLDRRLLLTIIDYYDGGPVGIEALAATLQEETDTLVDVIEPYLLKIGFVIRTPSGRKASSSAYEHLGVEPGGKSGQLALGEDTGQSSRQSRQR